jgi:glucokinase
MPEQQVTTETSSAASEAAHLPLVVGVDLGGTQLRVAVLRGAALLSRVSLLTGDDATPERLMPRIYQAIHQAIEEAGIHLEQVAGIGLGAPGPLNSKTGVIYSPPNLPGWENVPIRDLLQKEFPVPIFIENDAHCAALGEYMFGAGQGSEDMVYMTVSTGIGGGIISKGKLLEGSGGTAGELGHMTIDLHGPRCNCGNTGCLEAIASGTAIARRANEAIAAGQGEELLAFARSLDEQLARQLHLPADQEQIERVNARTVGEAARAGVPLAQQIIAEAAEGLGVGLVNVIHIFNPRKIILGGGVMQLSDLMLGPALAIVEQRAMKAPRSLVSIEMARLGPNVGLVGAGTLIYYHS